MIKQNDPVDIVLDLVKIFIWVAIGFTLIKAMSNLTFIQWIPILIIVKICVVIYLILVVLQRREK